MNAKEAKRLTQATQQRIFQENDDVWSRYENGLFELIEQEANAGKKQINIEFSSQDSIFALDVIASQLASLGYTVKKGVVVTADALLQSNIRSDSFVKKGAVVTVSWE